MSIQFRKSPEGEIAHRGAEVLGTIIAPLRRGGDFWCRITSTGVVFKGLTLETARMRIVDEIHRQEGAQDRAKEEALQATSNRPSQPVSLPIKTDLFRQGVVAAPGRTFRTMAHPKSRGGQRVAIQGEVRKAQPQPELSPCPICKVLIGNRKKHFKKRHPEAAAKAAPAAVRATKSKPPATRPAKRIVVATKVQVAAASKPARVKKSGQKFKLPGRPTPQQVDAASDATRYYSSRFRELGRFGSASSHDDYDDESMA